MDVVFFFVINLVVFFGNVFLCIVFFKNNNLWLVINVFVLILVVCDILMFIIFMFLLESVFIVGEWIFGEFFCYF